MWYVFIKNILFILLIYVLILLDDDEKMISKDNKQDTEIEHLLGEKILEKLQNKLNDKKGIYISLFIFTKLIIGNINDEDENLKRKNDKSGILFFHNIFIYLYL